MTKQITHCENCGALLEGYGNSSYFLNEKKTIRVCDACNMLEIELRLKNWK